MSSLAVGRGLEDLELWLGGLFTAAEIAAADLLLQLSVAGARRDDEAAAAESSSATTCSSRRSANPCLEDLDAEAEKRVVVKEPPVSTELDMRARKSSGAKKKKKRKRHHHHGDDHTFGSSSSEGATRYGGDHY
ncbi:uncharacterized protein [Lolium perenne]|uniref:uncharacterized protein n=1 Tax=Lolium perenne TaxID=4522 RepID=UPI0021F66A1B|nr:uncharacterized protein LOC127302730 [Lolium perenne]